MDYGLIEGTPNTHPGQGTANRRFFFHNFMLELLYLTDPVEARNEPRLRLAERWEQLAVGASPFGIILRPGVGDNPDVPFPSWEYAPRYFPAGMRLHAAEESPLSEPAWFYFPGGGRPDERLQPINPYAVSVRIASPFGWVSPASRAALSCAELSCLQSDSHLLELVLEGSRRSERIDFRPHLPVLIG